MKKKTSETVIVEGRFYTIASPNGRVLEVANYNPESGAAIQLWDYAGAQWQQWTFVPVGADTYRICNRFTGKAIDLCLGGTGGWHLAAPVGLQHRPRPAVETGADGGRLCPLPLRARRQIPRSLPGVQRQRRPRPDLVGQRRHQSALDPERRDG